MNLLKGLVIGGIKFADYMRTPERVRVIPLGKIDKAQRELSPHKLGQINRSARSVFLPSEARQCVQLLHDSGGLSKEDILSVLRGDAVLMLESSLV